MAKKPKREMPPMVMVYSKDRQEGIERAWFGLGKKSPRSGQVGMDEMGGCGDGAVVSGTVH